MIADFFGIEDVSDNAEFPVTEQVGLEWKPQNATVSGDLWKVIVPSGSASTTVNTDVVEESPVVLDEKPPIVKKPRTRKSKVTMKAGSKVPAKKKPVRRKKGTGEK